MANLTVKECAKMSSVTTRTIQKKIKEGKLSATKDEKGNYIVETTEFFRVYPNANNSENINESFGEKYSYIQSINQLKQEVFFLKKENEILKNHIKSYENREMKLLDTLQSNTRLLENKQKRKKILGIF